MGGCSDFKLGDFNAFVYLGYEGGSLKVEGVFDNLFQFTNSMTNEGKEEVAKLLRTFLFQFDKEELINALVEMVRNGEGA